MKRNLVLVITFFACLACSGAASAANTIKVTAENYAHKVFDNEIAPEKTVRVGHALP